MSAVSSVTSGALGVNDNAASDLSRLPTKTLGQSDFLKLLVAQLTAQDPLSPMKDTEFISGMASFTSLEQSKTMQEDMALLRADQLLGRTVSVKDAEDGVHVGVVSTVHVMAGKPKLQVDGADYDLGQVVSVSTTLVLAS
jgi:flagellar basal-body rod modification protein FlgD